MGYDTIKKHRKRLHEYYYINKNLDKFGPSVTDKERQIWK